MQVTVCRHADRIRDTAFTHSAGDIHANNRVIGSAVTGTLLERKTPAAHSAGANAHLGAALVGHTHGPSTRLRWQRRGGGVVARANSGRAYWIHVTTFRYSAGGRRTRGGGLHKLGECASGTDGDVARGVLLAAFIKRTYQGFAQFGGEGRLGRVTRRTYRARTRRQQLTALGKRAGSGGTQRYWQWNFGRVDGDIRLASGSRTSSIRVATFQRRADGSSAGGGGFRLLEREAAPRRERAHSGRFRRSTRWVGRGLCHWYRGTTIGKSTGGRQAADSGEGQQRSKT